MDWADKAASMMEAHLRHIQGHLDLGTKSASPVDLVALFGRS